MQTLVDTPTQLIIKVRDVEYSRPGKIINFVSLMALTIAFLYLLNIAQIDVLTALLTALFMGSPIFLINTVWLGRQNKIFTFDKSLEKLIIERQSCFLFRTVCILGILVTIFFILSCLNKTNYIKVPNTASLCVVTLMLSFPILIVLYWFSTVFLSKLITKIIKWQYLFSPKFKVREYWLRHIKDVKVQCVETSGVAYGTVIKRCQCKIMLLGALHVEIENDPDASCDQHLAQYIGNRIKVFLAN